MIFSEERRGEGRSLSHKVFPVRVRAINVEEKEGEIM
jgi:hypothetical protein